MKTTEQFLLHVDRLGVHVWEHDGDLHYSAPVEVLTPDLCGELDQRKVEILGLLRQAALSSHTSGSVIRPIPRVGAPVASFAQRRLWFLNQLEPDTSAYNVPAAYRLSGALDIPILEQAINEVVRRHEMLRTSFATVDGEPVQLIAPSLHVPLPLADLQLLPKAEQESEALRLAVLEAHTLFDLCQVPLLRTRLLRLGAEEHILVLTLHHIITDGWSIAVFKHELADLYSAFSQGRPSPLPELPVQYADFAVWQRKWLEGGVLADQLAYWRERLEAASDFQLPGDRPRPALLTFDGAQQAFSFSPELSLALKALSQQEGLTLFMTLLAAFKVLLYRYTGQEDIVVGTPIANRDRAEIEGLIGFFVNTLVLRTDLSPSPSGELTFHELLTRVREVCLEAYAHQHLPFEMLVEEVQPQRDLSRNPLFQVLLAVQNAPQAEMEMAGLTVTPLVLDFGVVRFDLECHLWEERERIRGVLVYNTNLFDATTIERMLGHFQTLLEGIVADPGQQLSDLPLLTKAERHQMLVEWNSSQAEYPTDMTVHQLFEAQVERTPESVAVVFEDKALTYIELNHKANQLAHFLRRLGVAPEVLVGLCVERSLEMVVGLLGILKAGGAYVPLDPTYPQERLSYILKDTRASVVVTQAGLVHKLGDCESRLVCLDTDREAIALESVPNLENEVSSDGLIYVMYTSGSTGHPKGVGVTHRGVVCLVKGDRYVQFDREVFLQLSPLSFDASTFEIWGPLLNGARLVVMGLEMPSLEQLGRTLKEGGVTTLWLTAGLFHLMVDERPRDLEQLHQLLAGGDVLSVSDVAKVVKELPAVQMINGYGPTENTTFSTCFTVPGSLSGSTVPIGRPIANTLAFILDRKLQPLPVGVAGELYLGGPGLARGYLNNPGLTAERFVPDPFCTEGGGRLYRTGDLARFLPDGNIEFLGRSDDQVKIRGFRVEPAEIEMVLGQHPAVRQCVVLALEDAPGESPGLPRTGRRLVAYVVPNEMPGPTLNELRTYLKVKLPEYMIPTAFVYLESFPLMPNGKLDRSALPAPDQFRPLLEEAFIAPRTPVEVKLAEIWAKVLGLERVGIHDDFFDLGGHSLLGIRLFARIEKDLGKKLPVALLFQSPTVELLAQAICDIKTSTDWSMLVPIQAGGSKPPFYCVHGFGGGVIGYMELARLLGPEQPFYGFQAKGLTEQDEPDSRIEDMATHYLQAMRTVQPEGPYHIGGYCYGGIVAFEMARQLRSQGEQVPLLAVMEGYALTRSGVKMRFWHPRGLARFLLNLPYWLRDTLHEPGALQNRLDPLRYRLWRNLEPREWDKQVERVIAANFGDGSEIPGTYRSLMAMHLKAMRDYHPQEYPGRLTLFRVQALRLFRSIDPEMGWENLATGGVTVRIVDGAHYNMLEKPHVESLAASLKESLAQSQNEESLRQIAAKNEVGL